jgi:hypothetical protein
MKIPHVKSSYVKDPAEMLQQEIEARRNIDMLRNKDGCLLVYNEYWCQ